LITGIPLEGSDHILLPVKRGCGCRVRAILLPWWYNKIKSSYSHILEVNTMWLKITPDMDLMMEVDLQGVDERSRDFDVQLYEKVVHAALMERLKKAFAEEDIAIHFVNVGIAREKYIKPKAA
jgi:hypothetical protein